MLGSLVGCFRNCHDQGERSRSLIFFQNSPIFFLNFNFSAKKKIWKIKGACRRNGGIETT